MLSAVTSAMLLLAVHSANAKVPADDRFVQRVSAACLEGASQSITQSVDRLQAQLTALEKKLTAPPCPDRQCPHGWTRGSDSCFLVPSNKTTWPLADGACARLDNRARLGSMHADTAAIIRSLSPNNVWLGLSHLSASSPWFWIDGTDLDYVNWDGERSQPDNGGGELCALTDYRSPRGWHDYSCTGSYFYLCEIKLH